MLLEKVKSLTEVTCLVAFFHAIKFIEVCLGLRSVNTKISMMTCHFLILMLKVFFS